MTKTQFKNSLEDIENTLMDMRLCQQLIIFYIDLPIKEKKLYCNSIEYIKEYYQYYCEIRKSKEEKNNSELSEDIIKKMNESIDGLSSKEEVAYKIYYELCKILAYDEDYIIATDGKVVDEIFEKNTSEVNSDNNKVVCSTWAKIYASLLNKNGIPAVVYNFSEQHRNVLFEINNMIYKADATELNYSEKTDSHMSDIARIKMGMLPNSILNFYEFQVSGNKNYNEYIKKLYESMRIYLRDDEFYNEFIEDLENFESLYNSNGSNLRECFKIDKNNDIEKIVKKLSIINKLISNCKLENIELMQYINNLIDIVFDEIDEKNISDTTIIDYLSGELKKLIAVKNNESEYSYYTIDNNGVNKIQRENLSELFDNGDFVTNDFKVNRNIRIKMSIKNWKEIIPGFDGISNRNGDENEIQF